MNVTWNRNRLFERHGPAGKILLVSMLVLAGIGAAIAPFLADLLTAAAGAPLVYCLVLAVWATLRQNPGRAQSTKFVEAI